MQEITAASMEQSSGANQISDAIQQLNEVTQQNAASSEENGNQRRRIKQPGRTTNKTQFLFRLKNITSQKKIKNQNRKKEKP